jgi:hypothetical protein
MIQFLESGDTIEVRPFFNQDPPPGFRTNQDPWASFCKCPDRFYSLVKPTPPATVDQVKAGRLGMAAFQFRWLPYVAGLITYVPLNNDAIITGKFTGCWLAIFRKAGQQYLAHIGTDTLPTSPLTIDVKASWREAVRAGLITEVAAVKPTDYVKGAAILAGLTPKNEFVCLGFDYVGGSPTLMKVKSRKVVAGAQSPVFR